MNALSNSLRRRFPSWYPGNNIRFQWTVVGLVAMLAAIAVGYTVEYFSPLWWVGTFTSTALAVIFSAPFIFAALVFPLPTQEPWIVQKYGDLSRWWEDVSRPARLDAFEGKLVLSRWFFGAIKEIYNENGYLIATEYHVNWSSTDIDWRPGDEPQDFQVKVTHYDSNERLSWLALLRSPKLPTEPMAEILDSTGNSIGQTTFTIH